MKAIANVVLGFALFILVTAALAWLWVYCHPLIAFIAAAAVMRRPQERKHRRI